MSGELLRNLDWTTKSFDYYVNDTLIRRRPCHRRARSDPRPDPQSKLRVAAMGLGDQCEPKAATPFRGSCR